MYATCRWLAVGLLVLTVGCNKSEPAGTGTGAAASVPAKAPTTVAADVAMNNLGKSIGQGDAAAIWEFFPAKHQADMTGLKNEFASKMDADVWNKTFIVVGKVANVLKTKKDFIMKSPAAAQADEKTKEQLNKNWDALVTSLSTLANSEIKTLDGLKATDPGKFLASTGTTIGASIVKAADAVPEAKQMLDQPRSTKFTLVKSEGDKATLKIESPDKPATEEVFVKVDGKWVPEDMVKEWDETMTKAKEGLKAMAIPPEQKTAILGVLTQVETTVDKLAAAKDQAAFDQEIGMAFMQLLPVLGGFGGGGMSGPPGAMGGPPPGSLPGSGATPPSVGGTLPPTGGPSLTPPTITPPVTTPKP